ncbi:MAG: transglutaminase domain-containing protein [Agathobacter sp.]|nr:transglutaminase domain-containing protein [Agathobacter sp.]
MNVKNWRFSYSKEKKEWKQNILDTVSLWGAIGLLWFSFISIIGEHFPEYLEKVDWWVIVLFAFLLWLGYEWPKNYLKKLVLPCRVAGILIPVGYVLVNLERIIDGFIQLAGIYLPHFNSYYGMNLYLGAGTEKANAVVAFTAISMLLWELVWFLAYGWKKRVLLVLFPVFALVLELVVGLSPVGAGLLYMFFAAMLLVLLGGTSIAKKAVALVLVWISVLLAGAGFGENIQNLATKEAKQDLLNWQNNLSFDSFNIFKLLQIDLHFNWEQLNNNAPQYTGKTVLEIEMNEKPDSTVYLKGFYATNYNDGNWTYDDSALKAACRKAGKSTEDVAEQIFQMLYERMREYYGANLIWDREYKIQYTGTTGDVAYIPYGVDYTSLDQPYTLMGDYLFKKAIWDKEITGEGLEVWTNLNLWMWVNDRIEKGFDNRDALLYCYGEPIDLTEQTEELAFLNGLSEAYLQVPENEEYLIQAGEVISRFLPGNDYKVLGHVQNENYRRLKCAEVVCEYLEDQMSYSLKLDKISSGMDPIEYALTVSHEGYCMHFASAATLLLRNAGVPARYISGYAVKPSAFIADEETGVYKAQVGDFMAHAWVEIYLDNIGWIPVDPTPGSSLGSLPSEDDMQRWEDTSELHRQEFEDEEPVSESEESEQPSENTETEIEDSQVEEPQEDTQTELETENTEGNGIAGNENTDDPKLLGKVVKVLGIVGAIAVLGGLLFTSVKYGVSRYEAILSKEIEKKMTRRAVRRINRRLYGRLRVAKISSWFQRKWSDVAYRNALVEQFTNVSEEEWDKFMDIVKKNHYSHETISMEEMQYCYECYKKAKLFNISLTKLWDNQK